LHQDIFAPLSYKYRRNPIPVEMTMFPIQALKTLEEYFADGDIEIDFCRASDAEKGDLLELLEKLMDLGDSADAAATKLIFQNSFLGALTGTKDQT